METKKAFEYGGYHFIPERMLEGKENTFEAVTKRLRTDPELGLCRVNYAYPSKYPYSHQSFYDAATDKNCDLFRCVENGKLYIPCTNDLQIYMDVGN